MYVYKFNSANLLCLYYVREAAETNVRRLGVAVQERLVTRIRCRSLRESYLVSNSSIRLIA